MARNHRSARQAGSAFERLVADYLAAHVDDRIDRRPKMGARDRGDIAGLRHKGHRLVIECKNTTRPALAQALAEAEVARGNDDALAGVVALKRHGKAAPGEQLITMTLAEFVAILNGDRGHQEAGK